MASHKVLSLVDNDPSEGTERRAAPRVRVLLNARLITITDELPVKVRDISPGGVLVEGEGPFPKGKDVVLRRRSAEVFARVAWTKGTKCGLEFEEPMSEAELLAFIHQPPQAASPVLPAFPERPGLTSETLTPEQWAIIEAWGRPVGRPAFGE